MPHTGSRGSILFVSTMGDRWGGSEELWSRTAINLAAEGWQVAACVHEWEPLHPRVIDLKARGVDVRTYRRTYRLSRHPLRWLASRRVGGLVLEIDRLISEKSPALIVVSDGAVFPPIELLEFLSSRNIRFATLSHANSAAWWWPDETAARLRAAMARALRCFFVSRANLNLARMQIGAPIENAEVVWNPVNLAGNASAPWPPLSEQGALHMACVGRLHPPTKGQDILFQTLAAPLWRERSWRLSLYGEGPMRQILERLAASLGISDRVTFAGFVPAEDIWAISHVLVLPSRLEGLPLTIVEAMLCARPVVATDVAGNAEVIEDGVTGFLADAPTALSVSSALDRFWRRLGEAEEIGAAGARRIRELVPSNPVQEFADKLKKLANLTGAP